MKLIHCEYCGTEYNDDLAKCPLCGRTASDETQGSSSYRSSKRGGARVAPKKAKRAKKKKNPDRIPQWMWAVICVILGIAVLIGLLYFLISMDYIGKKDAETAAPAITVPESYPEEINPSSSMTTEDTLPEDLSCRSLELSQTGIILDEPGASVFLAVTTDPVNCTDPVLFSSMDASVATVDSVGLIKAVGRGQTDILVTCGNVTESCIVICDFEEPEEEPVPEEQPEEEQPAEEEPAAEEQEEEQPEETPVPELSSVDFTLFRPGEETTLGVKNVPDGAAVTFASSNPDVVTVSATGKVKAIGNGVATITVMVNDVKLTCVARCNLGTTAENTETAENNTVLGTLSLNLTDVSLFSVGESFTLSLRDSAGNKASGVSWSSSNGGVCSVDANGRVSALGSGTATVKASYNGQTYSCIIRCNF